MDIEKLRSFVEVYACRNITQASEKLYISQSTLSRRIQMLEEELCTELFIRSGSKLMPTKSADILYYDAGKLIKEHDQLAIKMARVRKGTPDSISVGINPGLNIGPVLRATAMVKSSHPELEIYFDCDANTRAFRRYLNDEIDVGITVLGELAGIDNVNYEVLCRNSFAVMVGRGHRLWKKGHISIEDVKGECLYCTESLDSTVYRTLLAFLRSRGVSFSEISQCRSPAEQMMNIAKGDGIGLTGIVSNELYFVAPDLIEVTSFTDTQIDNGYIVALYHEDNKLASEYVKVLKQIW